MTTLDPPTQEALLEALCDLKHDLGKYIKLPVSMLPRDALRAEVASSVVRAIRQTRKGPEGERGALDIYASFIEEWDGVLRAYKGYPGLKAAVDEAVSWADTVAVPEGNWKREDVEKDLSMVALAIETLIREVERGD